jgi:hypothetical protein
MNSIRRSIQALKDLLYADEFDNTTIKWSSKDDITPTPSTSLELQTRPDKYERTVLRL